MSTSLELRKRLCRVVFVYGDVLTISKWHKLAYVVLRKMTTIGKEDYLNVMMSAHNSMIMVQDYLHEKHTLIAGNFQDILWWIPSTNPSFARHQAYHEHLTKVVLLSIRQHMIWCFMNGEGNSMISEFHAVNHSAGKSQTIEFLGSMQANVDAYQKKCATSKCKKSRFFALCA